ncbi:MAG: hypothetical protein ACE10C_15525 [Candidatus Binatia bacterium]
MAVIRTGIFHVSSRPKILLLHPGFKALTGETIPLDRSTLPESYRPRMASEVDGERKGEWLGTMTTL